MKRSIGLGLPKLIMAVTLVALGMCCDLGQRTAQGVGVVRNDLSTVRSAAILTTSDVASTFTVPQNTTYQVFYIDFTLGSLTNVVLTPAGAATGNPATSGYYKTIDSASTLTLTANGSYMWRLPSTAFGGYTYRGIVAKGTGTVTGSSLTIRTRSEQP